VRVIQRVSLVVSRGNLFVARIVRRESPELVQVLEQEELTKLLRYPHPLQGLARRSRQRAGTHGPVKYLVAVVVLVVSSAMLSILLIILPYTLPLVLAIEGRLLLLSSSSSSWLEGHGLRIQTIHRH